MTGDKSKPGIWRKISRQIDAMSLKRGMRKVLLGLALFALAVSGTFAEAASGPGRGGRPPERVVVDWNGTSPVHVVTTPSLQVVVNPLLRRNQVAYPYMHDAWMRALSELGAKKVRFVPWLPYPRLAVAQLEPPDARGSHWDTSLIDPIVQDFMIAQEGRSSVMNFSTIPQWLFNTAPSSYPTDPNQLDTDYEQGKYLKDPSNKALANYYEMLFTHYKQLGYGLENWEVFNEIETEYSTTPDLYNGRYDAIVARIRQISPQTKFTGLALSWTPEGETPEKLEYFRSFLDPGNHAPGTPLDYVSYHFYAFANADRDTNIDREAEDFFDQTDRFITSAVLPIETIRKALSPGTRVLIDEAGTIDEGRDLFKGYWNLSAACFAYLYAKLAPFGIDTLNASQLVAFPSQFPSVAMIDWTTGLPNARWSVLKLMIKYFGPGTVFEKTKSTSSHLFAQGFKRAAQRGILLVNKSATPTTVRVADAHEAVIYSVGGMDGSAQSGRTINALPDDSLKLDSFAVAFVIW